VGPITSVYRWEGAVQTDQEWRIEIKTASARVADLTDYIKEHHSYDVPEIIAVPIQGGSVDYLAWLVEVPAPGAGPLPVSSIDTRAHAVAAVTLPDGRGLLATAGDKGTLELWDVRTNESMGELSGR